MVYSLIFIMPKKFCQIEGEIISVHKLQYAMAGVHRRILKGAQTIVLDGGHNNMCTQIILPQGQGA
jgi:hypothetical protein